MVDITAQQVQMLLEDGEPIDSLDEALGKIVDGFKPGVSDSVTLTLTIKNDLEEVEDETDEDEESSED